MLEEEDLDTSRLLKLMLMLKLKLMLLEVVDLAKLPRIPLSWSAATWTPWCTRSTLSWAESCRWCPICCLTSSFRSMPPQVDTELGEMAKYYFDGAGKGLRPVIAMCVGHAFNVHTGKVGKAEEGQRMVAIISEMIHTASLVHDDILDHAETRRGKVRVRKEGKAITKFYTNAQGLGEPEVGRPEEHNGRGLYSCSRLKTTCENRQSRGFNKFAD